MKRRESRETAFALLFEWSFHDNYPADELLQNALEIRGEAVSDFTENLTRSTIAHCDELDRLIEQYSKGWKLNRISRVTLAALRLAFCELTHFDDIPSGATINEAVELVKKYGTQDEAAYLNGILGTYERGRVPVQPAE